MANTNFPNYKSFLDTLNLLVGREVIQAGFKKDETSKLVLRVSTFEDKEGRKMFRQLLLEREVAGKKLYKLVDGRLSFDPLGGELTYALAKKNCQRVIYDPEYENLDSIPVFFPSIDKRTSIPVFPSGIDKGLSIKQEIYNQPSQLLPVPKASFTFEDGDVEKSFFDAHPNILDFSKSQNYAFRILMIIRNL